jgi:hypothetical protein
MAEFCKQCADELGFPESDFIDPQLQPGYYNTNLCEGCGPIQTDVLGRCISNDCLKKGHNHVKKYFIDHDDVLLYGLGLHLVEEGIPELNINDCIIIKQIDLNLIKNAIVNKIPVEFYIKHNGTYAKYKNITDDLYQLVPSTKPYNRTFSTGDKELDLSNLEGKYFRLGITNHYGDVELLDTAYNRVCIINPKHITKVN